MSEKTKYAVLRLEADESSPTFEEDQNKVDDIELELKELSKYMEKLFDEGILKNACYVGNAQFLETRGESYEYIDKAYELFKKDTEGVADKKILRNKELLYWPEWAEDIKENE